MRRGTGLIRWVVEMPKSHPLPPHPEFELDGTPVASPYDDAVARVLDQVDLRNSNHHPSGEGEADPSVAEVRQFGSGPRLRTARVRRDVNGRFVAVFRGGVELDVELDLDVDPALIARAADSGDRVLLEEDGDEPPVVVGVIATRLPESGRGEVLELRARTIILDAEDELVLRSGKAGMRLREDGDVELVGSRIVTVSRGLFRLVGKMLRLN
jgi:hypothetical protein